ncbi:MAG: hypothetical protein O7H39_11290 [Gammaproteobacteria bacterium]|nr:hypothetical protein [Gammaproteobacteria bacterium]
MSIDDIGLPLDHRRIERPDARRHGKPLLEAPLYWKVPADNTHGKADEPEILYRVFAPPDTESPA